MQKEEGEREGNENERKKKGKRGGKRIKGRNIQEDCLCQLRGIDASQLYTLLQSFIVVTFH